MIAKKDIKLFPMFPSPLWVIEREAVKGALEWALNRKDKDNSPRRPYSNIGGYQSTAQSIEDCPYKDHLISGISFLPKFVITGWWINVNEKGDYNVSHCHPDSDLAAVWYLTDSLGCLAFSSPFPMTRHMLYPSNDQRINSSAGTMLIFPSDMMHRVDAHNEKTSRVSLSFNIRLEEPIQLK